LINIVLSRLLLLQPAAFWKQ